MKNIIYKSILGSRSYDFAAPDSDVDVGVINLTSMGKRVIREKGLDVLPSSYSEFISDMLGPTPRWFFTQFLFPESFEEGDIAKYIIENREDIIGARLPMLYETIKRRGDGLSNFGDRLYKVCPKRLAYSTLFYSILANYAEGMPFALAHRPEGELHDFLIGMRLGQVPLEDAVARNALERTRAEKAAGFYRQAVHPEVLREFEQVIKEAERL